MALLCLWLAGMLCVSEPLCCLALPSYEGSGLVQILLIPSRLALVLLCLVSSILSLGQLLA